MHMSLTVWWHMIAWDFYICIILIKSIKGDGVKFNMSLAAETDETP